MRASTLAAAGMLDSALLGRVGRPTGSAWSTAAKEKDTCD